MPPDLAVVRRAEPFVSSCKHCDRLAPSRQSLAYATANAPARAAALLPSSSHFNVRVVPGRRVCPRRGYGEYPARAASLPAVPPIRAARHRPPRRPCDRRPRRYGRPSRDSGTAAPGAGKRTGASATDGYTARHLSVLEGMEAVRKRPGMYIGSTDGRGLMHCLWEIFDNSVDEALAGHCALIEVVLHPDVSAEVRDNGRGIPVDNEPKTGLSGVELVMTRLHAGGKFGGGSYTASGGLHGVGASVVNALAARLDVQVDRDGAEWAASFRRGVTGEFAADGPAAKFSRGSGLRKTRRVARKVTGTRIRFWPDRQVFTKDASWSFEALVQRARQTAYLVPGLTIKIRDDRSDADRTLRPARTWPRN